MSVQPDHTTRFDRALLLAGAKRNAVLDLWQVERYGRDSYGDVDYVSIYGLTPATWYARGIRLLGRTAVECTRDDLGAAIGHDVAAAAARSGAPTQTVIDPFAGSGNTLFWLLRHLPQARGLGFELDAGVFELTRKNLAALALPIEIMNVDYRSGLRGAAVGANDLLVVFVAPPWGDALDPVSGLDLRRTQPPIGAIVDLVLERFAPRKILCAVQVYEAFDAASMIDLTRRFDGSALRLYTLNAAGRNHGILLGWRGWQA